MRTRINRQVNILLTSKCNRRSRRPRRFADVKHLRSGKVVRSKRGAPGPTEERASKTRRTDPAAAVQPRLDLPAEPEDQIKDVLPKLDQNSVLLSLPGG